MEPLIIAGVTISIFQVLPALVLVLGVMVIFFGLRFFCASSLAERLNCALLVGCAGFNAYTLLFLSNPWVQEGMREEVMRWFS